MEHVNRVLIIGATGQLGRDVEKTLSTDPRLEVVTAARNDAQYELDLAVTETLGPLVEDQIRPDLVINTAAAHNVPDCEKAPASAYAVNATGVAALAESCARIEARLVHVSTDYVFGSSPPLEPESGEPRPWREDDRPAPLNAYAASKLAGEHLLAAACPNHAIVRSSGLYGQAPCLAKGGRNFVQLMLHIAAERGEVKVVTDEVLTPTATADLAAQIETLALSEACGVFHATCQGSCSWNEFARAIFEESGTDVRLLPATSEDFPSPVRRPAYSVLANARLAELGLDTLPHWREALRGYLRSIDAAV